jgi:16S rRNA (guanine527-N7)-methyltransferase
MNEGGERLLPELAGLPIELSTQQRGQLDCVLARLEADEHAPTAVRERAAATLVHLADSLAAAGLEALQSAQMIADLGSGAGFPGIALAVALPAAEVSLIEAQRRKCEFLTSLSAEARIGNATVVCTRVEDWREGLERHDAVLARALAPQPVVLEYAAPLLRIGGALVDWRGKRAPEEEEAAQRAAAMLGMWRSEVRRTAPFEGATDHHLHVFVKREHTPERFPRRAGMARKRPLAA